MLVADIHGKGMVEAQNHEDYLTSTVFGHLRYVSPTVFWHALFQRIKGLPDASGNEPRLSAVARDLGATVQRYDKLSAHFWANHPTLGQPDLILHFAGESQRPLILLVEAKLWAEKSGWGEWDQLARYNDILNDFPALRLGLPRDALCFLVYLTPRDSLEEIDDSARRLTAPAERARLFRLRWQDIAAVADEIAPGATEPARTILRDVSRFLRRRSLEYFAGFAVLEILSDLQPSAGHFYSKPARLFRGFSPPVGLNGLSIQKGGWL